MKKQNLTNNERKRSIVVSGYYGYHNLGDDTILEMICKDLAEDYELTVLSRRPSETLKEYSVRAIGRYDLREIIRVISDADLLISGGGTLLQDRSSVHSLLYYLLVLKIAQQCSVPTMIYAAGIGPVIHRFSMKAISRILSKVNIISLRDRQSQKFIHKLSAEKGTILTADPVLRMEVSADSAVELFFTQNRLTDKKMFAVSLRKMNEKEQRQMSILLDKVAALSGFVPVFICMQESEDLQTTLEVQKYMSQTHSVLLNKRVSGPDMAAILKRMQCVIGLRLHALVIGSLAGIHLIGVDVDPKISAFLEELDTELLYSMTDITDEKTAECIVRIMSEPCKYDLTELKERSNRTKELVHAFFDQRESTDR